MKTHYADKTQTGFYRTFVCGRVAPAAHGTTKTENATCGNCRKQIAKGV